MNILFICFIALISAISEPQNLHLPDKGVPFLVNYAPAQYFHQGKIWDIDSAPNGIVYMAADKGLLEFDGRTWNKFSGSAGIIRSIKVINDTLIYTGSDLDFGVWKRESQNNFEYTSLYPFKDELARLNEEFWNIHEIDNYILFLSADNIYVYKNQNLTKITAPNKIISSFEVDNVIYFEDEKSGLYQLDEFSPKLITKFSNGFHLELIGLFRSNNELILATKNQGLFTYSNGKIQPINSRLSRELKNGKVFSLEYINDTHIAFGTVLKGLIISDLKGNIVHYINKNKGLQNNTILSVHHSKTGKLWMGMDYGISSLDIGSAVTFFHDYQGTFGTGYSAVLKNEMFFLGTNQGLYTSKWENLSNDSESNRFTLLNGTEGQVWTLKNIDDNIWMGHDKGLFLVNPSSVEKLDDQSGYWTVQPYRNFILAGSYNGISIFQKNKGKWVFDKKMELILGSCNQVLIEGENILWVNIPNFGVIRAELTDELYPENRKIFLLEEFHSNEVLLAEEDGEVRVHTANAEFRYDSSTAGFEVGPTKRHPSTIQDVILAGMSEPILIHSDYEFYPIYNGFALKSLNLAKNESENIPNFIFRNIEAFNNDERIEIYHGARIPRTANNIRITGIVPNVDNVLYQYRLSTKNEWTEWSEENTFELIGLSHGRHKIFARAKVDGTLSATKSFDFSIATPWYFSWYAIFLYAVGFVFLLYVAFVWQKAALKTLKKQLMLERQNSLREQTNKHMQEIQHLEQERLEAEYEQVKAQLKSKTIELATRAKETERKNETLRTLKDKIENMQRNPDSFKNRAGELHRLLDSCIKMEDNTFEIQMDELHQEFSRKLRELFPSLSSNDLRLCAYIKTGFNSKELADLLNIQPSSVYISRSRLRKKLELDTEQDLHAFLNSI